MTKEQCGRIMDAIAKVVREEGLEKLGWSGNYNGETGIMQIVVQERDMLEHRQRLTYPQNAE